MGTGGPLWGRAACGPQKAGKGAARAAWRGRGKIRRKVKGRWPRRWPPAREIGVQAVGQGKFLFHAHAVVGVRDGSAESSTASKGPSSAIQRLMARRSASRSGGNRWFTSRGRMSPAYTLRLLVQRVRDGAGGGGVLVHGNKLLLRRAAGAGMPQIVGAESEHRVGEALDGKQVVAVALDAAWPYMPREAGVAP